MQTKWGILRFSAAGDADLVVRLAHAEKWLVLLK